MTMLEESMEDKEVAEKQRQAEGERAAQMAQEMEAKRRQEEAAEAEAVAKRAAEEAAHKAEEERKAEEARREEEMRHAEEARIADEERTRRLAEQQRKDEAKRKHRADILAGLPKPISYVLNPETDFDIESRWGKSHMFRHFTHIQVFSEERQDPQAEYTGTNMSTYWVPNILVAPLLGVTGIELFIRSDHESYGGSLAGIWPTKDFPNDRLPLLKTFMDSLPPHGIDIPIPTDENARPLLSHQELLQRRRDTLEGVEAAKRALSTGTAVLRYVRLKDILRNMHPSLDGIKVDIRFDHLPLPATPAPGKSGFFASVKRTHSRPRARSFIVGGTPDVSEFLCRQIKRDSAHMTDVRIVHEK